MLELVSTDYLSGRVWRPNNIQSRFMLQHLIGKDSIDDNKLETLELLAEMHNVEVHYL